MRAVITVIGKDEVGILAKVAVVCAKYNVNVTDVSQSILQDVFAMIMMVDLNKISVPITELADELKILGKELGLNITVMHEDVFNCMHTI